MGSSYTIRVLMVTGEYPPRVGGVGDYTARLSRELIRLGAEVRVQTTHVPTAFPASDPLMIKPVRSWGFTAWPSIAGASSIHRAQVVHIQYQAAAFAMRLAVNLLPTYLRIRRPSMKVVTTFHDLRAPYLFPKAGLFRQGALRIMDRCCHASVLTNQADFEALCRAGQYGSGGLKHWLIPIGSNVDCCPPTGYDRDTGRRRWGAGGERLVLSYFGLMNESKGFEFLVEAVAILVQRGQNPLLLVVGGEAGDSDPRNRDYARRMAELVRARGLEERCVMTGHLPPEEVSAALLASDVCVLPYRDGASARRGSLLAAIAHGLPVVTTAPRSKEPLLKLDSALVMVQPDDGTGLADAIEGLWRNPRERAALASKARELGTHFDWTTIAKKHLELYSKAMEAGWKPQT